MKNTMIMQIETKAINIGDANISLCPKLFTKMDTAK